jgi:hypothetical protein
MRYDRQFPVVAFECDLPHFGSSPADVLGVTADRFLMEVEVKVALSDFRADAKKFKWATRRAYPENSPRFFYYAVPKEMREKVEGLLPEGAGLMVVGSGGSLPQDDVCVVVKAKANTSSKRIPLRDLIQLVRGQSATLVRLALKESEAENATTTVTLQEGLKP